MACVEEPRRLIASLSKWLRFHRRRSCGSMRGSLLSGCCIGTAGRGRRCRVLLLPVLVACLLVALLGVPRSGLQSSSGSSAITASSIPQNGSGMGPGCNPETGSMCGFGLLPDVLCPETRNSQVRIFFPSKLSVEVGINRDAYQMQKNSMASDHEENSNRVHADAVALHGLQNITLE